MKVRDNGAAFLPLLFLLEVDRTIWDVEILAEAPFIAGAQDGRNSGFEVVVDVCGCKVWKLFKKFGRLPCVKGTGEVLAGAEQSELLQFMVCMVKYCVWAEVFLELTKQAS